MANTDTGPINSGDQTTGGPADLRLSPEAQFRNINQRLETLTEQVGRISSPPKFNLADLLQIGMIVVGFVVATFTALGLSERISDLNNNLTQSEQRVTNAMNAAELRLQSTLDKLNALFISLDERLSKLEGNVANQQKHQ